MPENDKNDLVVDALREQRDSLKLKISGLQEQLEILETAIADMVQARNGTRVPKGRITSLVKEFILTHGPTSRDSLMEHIRKHGGVSMFGDIEKRLNQSLARCVTAGTMQESGGLYDLTERERSRIEQEGTELS